MNWGNKLLATFIVFGAGMSYLAYRSLNTNFELVEKDYYNKELKYQQVIDGGTRANALSSPVKIEQKEKIIILQMPAEMINKQVSGNIWFYCAYDQQKDKKFDLNLTNEGNQLFNNEIIAPGNYTVKITWNDGEKTYYSEEKLSIL